MKRTVLNIAVCLGFSVLLYSCGGNAENKTSETETQAQPKENVKIVTIGGAVTEVLAGLGMESNLVGVDMTSTYPESVKAKTQVGSSHNLNVESIIAAKPDYVISLEERGIKPEQATQLEQAGIKVWVIKQEYTIDGTKKLINTLADSFQKQDKAQEMIAAIDKSIAELPKYDTKPKVLFIYARGAGTLQVGGTGTPMATMIELAGGTNAGTDFADFKPLTAEALVKMNPDMILLFESGMQSLQGAEGLLKAPGVAQTTAGKNKAFIMMEGGLLSGFGPRVGDAGKQLGEKMHEKK